MLHWRNLVAVLRKDLRQSHGRHPAFTLTYNGLPLRLPYTKITGMDFCCLCTPAPAIYESHWHSFLRRFRKQELFVELNHTPVGAFYNAANRTCLFSLWAPLPGKVELLILSPDTSTHAMSRDSKGYWSVVVDAASPGMRYMYRIDEDYLVPDPASRSQPDGVHEASAIVHPNDFQWTDENWQGLQLEDMIIYELHTGTFTSQQNFRGIISRLGYLQSLGINAIEIMPVAQFPGRRNWGYDGVYPFAIHNTYGHTNDLKELVNRAHHMGMAVILDVVCNHLGPEGNYVGRLAPWFTDKYKTPWGPAINFDDAWCDGVRDYYLQNVLMWLHEFHIDALRLDAVHAIWDNSARHFMSVLSDHVRELSMQTGIRKSLIAELDLNNPRYITGVEKGGYGMDGQWADEFHHALHVTLTREKDGYYEDFDGLSMLAKSFREGYVYTGEYSPHRKRYFGAPPDNIPYGRFVVFAQNHDQVGNRLLGDRLTCKLLPQQLRLAAAAVLLSPHVPLLFMGEEYSETHPFMFFTNHSDPALIESLREGRRQEFASFQWEGEVPDPQSEELFRRSTLSWQTDDKEKAAMLQFYRDLIAFRKTRPAMRGRERESVIVHTPRKTLLAIERHWAGDSIFILFNFGNEIAKWVRNWPFALRRIMYSSDEYQLHGHDENLLEVQTGQELALKPWSMAVFEKIA